MKTLNTSAMRIRSINQRTYRVASVLMGAVMEGGGKREARMKHGNKIGLRD